MIFDVNKNAGIQGVMSLEDVYAWRDRFYWPDFSHIAVQGNTNVDKCMFFLKCYDCQPQIAIKNKMAVAILMLVYFLNKKLGSHPLKKIKTQVSNLHRSIVDPWA